MKQKYIINCILEKCQRNGWLSFETCQRIRQDAISSQSQYLFIKIKSELTIKTPVTGWNKFWDGTTLVNWYGKIVLTESISSICIGINNLLDKDSILRNYLNLKHQKKMISQGSIQEIVLDLIFHCGFENDEVYTNAVMLKFLQRLNLYHSKKTNFEHWHWKGTTGNVVLSNNGRCQVSRELVWAKSIEYGLLLNRHPSNHLLRFLKLIDPAKREVELELKKDDCLIACLKSLQFYGFAKVLQDRVQFALAPGLFPNMFMKLWNVS